MNAGAHLRTLVNGKGVQPLLCLLLVLCCWSRESLAFSQGASSQNHRRARQIIFEGELQQIRKNSSLSCKVENGEIFVPRESKCYPLLKQGPCANGELVLLDLRTGKGKCSPNPCAVADCGTPPCPDTFGKVLLPTGEVFCDCDVGSLFWPSNGKCYGAFTRGPCKPGQVIATVPSGKTMCRPRMCPEGYVMIRGECRAEGRKGPCRNNTKVGIGFPTYQSECLDIEPHFFITAPDLPRSLQPNCNPGSRMNHAGLCINSLRTTPVPRTPRICPPDFESYFNRCIRRV